MERRFKLFHRAKVRDIKSFNHRPKAEQTALFEANGAEADGGGGGDGDGAEALPDRLPYWVIIIDELADLMLMAQQEIEPQIQKLTQLARATGIHMIIATQRPTVDIITGTIKSNIPGRVAFKVAQKNDSRVVLDQEGADKLVGKGDMLVLTGANKLTRAQGAWTKDEEIQLIGSTGSSRICRSLTSGSWGRRGRPEAWSCRAAGGGRGAAAAGDRGDPADAPGEHVVHPAAAADRYTRRRG